MGKEKPPKQALEEYSRGRLQTHLSEWVVNPLEEDYAFDFEVRTTNPFMGSHEVSPTPFYIQLKSSHYFDDSETVWYDFETEFLIDDCLEASVPVALVIYEKARDDFQWCIAQRYCWDVLDEEQPGWRDQKTIQIRLHRESGLGSLQKHQLRQAAEQVQRRISTREHVAASYRPSFAPTPGGELASTEQVRKYKRTRIEEALRAAEAGDTEAALQKLMDVYQLPETDEPTLDAIRHLVCLRETTDSSTAFTKIRFAAEGLQLADQYGRDELTEVFEPELQAAKEYIERYFIGATYRNTDSYLELDVLALEDWNAPDGGVGLVALVQYKHGELDDESAQAIADNDSYELVQSGAGINPEADACAERDHVFDFDDLREAPTLARCEDCGLSRETIQHRLNQDVPTVCDSCDSQSYAIEYRGDLAFCSDCL